MARIFVRRRDGRIEVRLNQAGRQFVHEQFARLRLAAADPDSPWREPLHQPIDPSQDADDPLRSLERESVVNSNAELALLSADEPFLTEAEAWAWLTSLQLALRATASLQHLATEEDLKSATPEELVVVHSLQDLLSDLVHALS